MTEAELEPLKEAALKALEHAYAPYSGYRVGAALLDVDGRVFTGCNVENAAFSPTLCAERVAVGKAVEAGSREFVAVVVATLSSPPATPCGVCRQVLREFGRELEIICVNPVGERRTHRLEELLPHGFSGEDLNHTEQETDHEQLALKWRK